jgi:hypothetical protein
MLLQQPCGQFGHGDVRLGLDSLDQKRLLRRKPSASKSTALPRRGGRSGRSLALQQLDGKAVANPKVARRRPAGVAVVDKRHYAHTQIERVALGHDPPPGQKGITPVPWREAFESALPSDALEWQKLEAV